jgi:hypothetical protein
MTLEVLFNAARKRVALSTGQHSRKVLHHQWIAVHGRERLAVDR